MSDYQKEWWLKNGSKQNQKRKDDRKNNPEKYKKLDAERYVRNKDQASTQKKASHLKDPRSRLLGSAKERSTKRGTPFTISLDDIVVPEFCPVFGEPLVPGDGKAHDFSPSLDEIIPGLGYVPGNIQVISFLANTVKSSMSPEQIKKFCSWSQNTH